MAKKLSRAGQLRASKKIRKLVHEGYGQKQAAAIAYAMERKHQLGPKGGKKVVRFSNPEELFTKPRLAAGPYRTIKVYAIARQADWTWWILSRIPKKSNIIQMSLVTSPVVPKGELGSVYKSDLIGAEFIDPWSEKSFLPEGYSWKD
jgi:hypothetical protein